MDSLAQKHANSDVGDKVLLDQFQEDNPHLKPLADRRRVCDDLWRLLTPRHRENVCCYGRMAIGTCLTDHLEVWQDTSRGYFLYVTHPYCDSTGDRCNEELKEGGIKLSEKGLTWERSKASWYYPGSALLTLIGRPEVVDGVTLRDPVFYPWEVREATYNVDAEVAEARRLGEEQVLRDRWVRKAIECEREGDFQYALNLRCDTAYSDRTGGFHKLARVQIQEAKRLIEEHPDLEVDFLYFANEKDRGLVCGPSSPILTRRQLTGFLEAINLPTGSRWNVVRGESASCILHKDENRWQLEIQQGGNNRRWGASLDPIHLAEGNYWKLWVDSKGEMHDSYGNHVYCHETPQEAATAALSLWANRYCT